MKFVYSQEFLEQCLSFKLLYTCDYCVYFAPLSDRCSHGYPTTDHRLPDEKKLSAAKAQGKENLFEEKNLVFCKEFEIL